MEMIIIKDVKAGAEVRNSVACYFCLSYSILLLVILHDYIQNNLLSYSLTNW